MLNIALPKGRLGEKVYEMFARSGFPCPSILEKSRKLTFENEELGIRFFWVKPSDVAVYVERGGHGSTLATIARSILDAYFNLNNAGEGDSFENQVS